MDFEWALRPITRSSLRTGDPTITNEDKKYERDWGNAQINSTGDNGNWTTKLGEGLVKKLFELAGTKIWKPERKNGIEPDWETDDYIIEVKTRNWTTTGTAGEKVLGVPYKYSDVPELYGKPLLIICVAYQEWELTHVDKMKIFGDNLSKNKKLQKKLWSEMDIHYIPFSRLFKDFTPIMNNEHTKVGGGEETIVGEVE